MNEWNQWRGPGRDGIIPADRRPARWPKTLRRSWQATVGAGYASPVVAGDRVFVFGRIGESETAQALDLRTGKPLWRESEAVPYTMNPAALGHGKGPKSTPLLTGGTLVTLGITGTLTAREMATGKRRWRVVGEAAEFGTAQSPLGYRGAAIVHVNGTDGGALTAFDLASGKPRWRWTGDAPAYASPILAGGALITQTRRLCLALNPATGKEIWRHPFATPYDQNSVTPTVAADRILFGGTTRPTLALDTRGKPLWETREATFYMSAPVFDGTRLWGFSERARGQFVCLDPGTGKRMWADEGRQGENASLWDAGTHLLALTVDGALSVFEKRRNALAQIARYDVASSAAWASPAFVPGGVLVKDENTVTLWRWA